MRAADVSDYPYASGVRAVIDIGTNSVLLLVGRRGVDGRVIVERDEARITRLGHAVAERGRLDGAAVQRTLAVLAEYRGIAAEAGAEVEAVATEGLRMASDQLMFLADAKEALGAEVRMISGDEEARLSYLSVAREHRGGTLRVLDIGGGSTELVAGVGERIDSQRSHAIGSVRLTERCVRSDPPRAEEIGAIADAARAAFAEQPLEPHAELHGLAGTVTTAAALLLELPRFDREAIDGQRFDRKAVVALRDRLALQSLDARTREPTLPRGRADVIVAGLTILDVALGHCGAQTLVVRDRGLRYALL